MKTIIVKSVSKTFPSYNGITTLFSNLNYTFVNNHTYALMGPSGSGKSTLLHLLAGIDKPSSGCIMLDERHVTEFSGKNRAKNIALVLQSSFFINELSVLENCAIAATTGSTKEAYQRAQHLLELVGLKEYMKCAVGVLSGGQRQRAALARALMNNPAFLIADELTGNLDHTTAISIMELLIQLRQHHAYGIILTTHDITIAAYMDTILKLEYNNLITSELP